MTLRLAFREAYSYEWMEVNPVLRLGEPGAEKDTGKFKLGDGESRWNDLKYFSPAEPLDQAITFQMLLNHIDSDEPHPVYDDGPSLLLLYENAKV